jgi:hypothetical protein
VAVALAGDDSDGGEVLAHMVNGHMMWDYVVASTLTEFA